MGSYPAGGGDVDPAYFGADLQRARPETIDRMRDELELGLAQAAMQRDVPLFGICRGCQVLNAAAGGGMVQHLTAIKRRRVPQLTTRSRLCRAHGSGA